MPHVAGNDNPSQDCGLRGTELLDAILTEIKQHPQNWDQNKWAYAKPKDFEVTESGEYTPASCGTAFCVAGWAAHMTGAKLDWKPRHAYDDYTFSPKIVGFEAETVNDNQNTVSRHASEVLGLGAVDAEILFRAHNTLEEIEDYVNSIKCGEPLFEDYSDDFYY